LDISEAKSELRSDLARNTGDEHRIDAREE